MNCMSYLGVVVRLNSFRGFNLAHIPHGGLRGNWAKASSKTPHSHSLCSSPGVVQERPKTLRGSASARKACTGGGGGSTG